MKFLLMLLLLPALAWAFPENGVIDDFNRTDANPVDGIWSNNVYGAANDGCQVLANILEKEGAGSDNGCWVTATIDGPSQEVYATMPNATNHSGSTNTRLLICLNGDVGSATVDGYGFEFQKITAGDDVISIVRVDDMAYTQLGDSVALEMDDGDKIGGEFFEGGTLKIWADLGAGWVERASRDDTAHPCEDTAVGAAIGHTSQGFDDFGAGTLTTDAGGPFMMLEFK